MKAAPLPSGRHGLSAEFVRANQRERLLDAVCRVTAARGYGAMTVSDVVAEAGVSRRVFYSWFHDREDCLLVCARRLAIGLLDTVGRASQAPGRDWPERVAVALTALLEQLANQPDVARLLLVEVLIAGEAARTGRERFLRRFREMLFSAEPLPAGIPPEMIESVQGGVVEVIYQEVLAGRTRELPQRLPDLLYGVLMPFLGHEAALAVCAGRRPPGRADADPGLSGPDPASGRAQPLIV